MAPSGEPRSEGVRRRPGRADGGLHKLDDMMMEGQVTAVFCALRLAAVTATTTSSARWSPCRRPPPR